MAWEWVVQLAPSVASLAAAAVGLARGQGKLRRNMRHDADLVKDLPEGSAARSKLLDHLEWQAQELNDREASGASRDWLSVFLGLVLSLGFGYLALWLVRIGGWWWLGTPLAATMALVGLVGLSDGIALKVRPTKEEKEAEKQRQREEKSRRKAEKAREQG